MMTGTSEIGRKLVGSEGFPDLKMGLTMECFQSLGMSARVMQVLTMWRMTPPIAGNPVLSIRTHTPSVPHAAEKLCIRAPRARLPSVENRTY